MVVVADREAVVDDSAEWMNKAATDEPIAPAEIDTSVAHNARVWNYWLGGKDHYAADRGVGDRVREMFPNIVRVAQADRAFLNRVVRFLAGGVGIRQFLDIGTGLPTADNTHEVAQRVAPESRIVYVDNDPIVLAHARARLTSTGPGATDYIHADVRAPGEILRAAADTLDFSQPIAVMLLGILNFVPDADEPGTIVDRLLDAVPSGSYLVITHPTLELGGEANAEAMRFWNENATPAITTRTRQEFAGFLERVELLEPGIVSCARWRPENAAGDDSASGADEAANDAAEVAQYGAVGRKP